MLFRILKKKIKQFKGSGIDLLLTRIRRICAVHRAKLIGREPGHCGYIISAQGYVTRKKEAVFTLSPGNPTVLTVGGCQERVSAGIDAGLSGVEGKLALAEHQWKLAEEKAALARQLTGEALSALVVLALRLMTDEKLSAQEACERLAIQGRLRDHIMPYLVS